MSRLRPFVQMSGCISRYVFSSSNMASSPRRNVKGSHQANFPLTNALYSVLLFLSVWWTRRQGRSSNPAARLVSSSLWIRKTSGKDIYPSPCPSGSVSSCVILCPNGRLCISLTCLRDKNLREIAKNLDHSTPLPHLQ